MYNETSGLIPVTVELWYDDRWNDITPDVDVSQGITIRRGRDDHQSSPSPSSCRFTLVNRDGKYSARNPLSPLHEKIGRNTPVRIRVGDHQLALRFTGVGDSIRPLYVITPARSEFNVPVLDLRVDMEPESWVPGEWHVVVARTVWNTGNYQWEVLQTPDGGLRFWWSYDGDYTNRQIARLDAGEHDMSGRCTLRVVVDTQSTSDKTVVDWYRGDSLDGPWKHLAQRVSENPGNLPIYPGDAPLTLGSSGTGGAGWSGFYLYRGLIHGVQLRDGSDGPVLAGLDISPGDQGPLGTESVTDSAGNTWEVHGTTRVVDASGSIRFTGLVSAWPPRWSSPEDVGTEIEAVGYRHLVDRASTPVRSPMFRACTNPGEMDRVLGYWPMEERAEATQFSSGIGGPPMLVGRIPGYHVRDIKFAAYGGFRASEPIPEFNDTAAVATLPSSEETGELRVFMLLRLSDVDTEKRIFSVSTSGSITLWTVNVDPQRQVRAVGRDENDNQIYSTPWVEWGWGERSLFGLWLRQDGPDIQGQIFEFEEDNPIAGVFDFVVPGQSLGAPSVVTLAPRSGLNGTAIGHLTVMNRDTQSLWGPIVDGFHAYHGESASDRIARLGREEQIPVIVPPGPSEPLGIQTVETIPRIFDEAAESDMGVLVDSRDTATLTYIPRERLYNQTPVEVDYEAHPVVAPMEPTDDDSELTNDVTVQRGRGSFYRAVQESGPLAAAPYPDGVGRYEASYTLSLADDSQVERQAHWRLHLGTVDEYRYPRIALDLHGDLHLADRIRRVDVSSRLRVVNLPPWTPPGNADVIVQGYEEYLDGIRWRWTANCSPASPWSVGVADDPVHGRADTAGSVLIGDVDSDTTDLPVLTTEGPLWIEEIEHFPFDVSVGGEIVTVVGVRPLLSDDFNRGDVGEWDYSVWDAGYWNSMVWGE